MKQKKLSDNYISAFTMELHLLVQAGIPLDEGIAMLRDGEDDAQIRNVLSQVYETLLDGYSLQKALEQSGTFPQYMVDMIGVGEETGNLDRGLLALSAYYDRQEQLRQNVRRAVLYPATLLVVLALVLMVLVVEVLPMFNDVYGQLGGTMTGLGAVILEFGIVLKAKWILAIALVFLAVAVLVHLLMQGQKKGERILFSKKIGLSVATAKLASALAMALHSGLDLDMAMEMARNLTRHPGLSQKIKVCQDKMLEGIPFGTVIGEVGLFSNLHCRMLSVGMQTGNLDQVMADLAVRCDDSAQDEIGRCINNVEPTLVVIMSLLVGVVLLSVMLPLASIMSALG